MSSRNKKRSITSTIEIGITVSPLLTFEEVRQILRCSQRSLFRYYKEYHNPNGTFVRPVLSYIRPAAGTSYSPKPKLNAI